MDARDFSRWAERRGELMELAGPVLASRGVQRLGAITFLGILSPRFAHLWPEEALASHRVSAHGDGSRLSHSMGVALLGVDVARSLGLSREAQRYAAVWGLLHDLGNWPLSHTGEPAFRELTGVTTRAARRALITGERLAPSLRELSVRPQLEEAGVDLERLLALMDHRHAELPCELRTLAEVMRSPLSPDAFEGMWRCARALGMVEVEPELLAASLQRSLHGTVQVRAGREALVLQFWKSKIDVYEKYLNHPDAIRLESSWAQAIQRELVGVTLERSLRLSEEALISRVQASGLALDAPLHRYKPPVAYDLARALPSCPSLAQVASVFVARPLYG